MVSFRSLLFLLLRTKLYNCLEKCCDEILIASSGPAEEYQRERLGVYKKLPNQQFNDKPLYRKVDGDDYLYFWKFLDQDNNGAGQNWLVSQDYKQDGHGIESPNMEWEERRCRPNNRTDICPWTCVEHINGLQIPWSSWTRLHRLGGFYRDTTLRVQCWSTWVDQQCCNSVILRSSGIGRTVQPERLGKFDYKGDTKHGRKVYRKSVDGQRDQFLYFWDWGPNNGGNWMVGLNSKYNARGIESADMENDMYRSICATEVQKKAPMKVWDRLFERWEVDNTLRLECFYPYIECCESIQIVSTGSLRFYHPLVLGNYSKIEEKHNRYVYQNTYEDMYLHYNDFGILEGTNWMISKGINDTIGLAVSQDQEHVGEYSFCADTSASNGPWLVLSDHGWQFDKTIVIKCIAS